MTILILGDESDEHARHVFTTLETRGASVEFLSTADFPDRMQLAFNPQAPGYLVLPSGRRIETTEIHSVYWRSYSSAQTPSLPDATQSFIAANDARSLLESFVQHIPARWVNGWAGYQMHQTKPLALSRAAAAGAAIPDTIITNDPDAVRHFAATHKRCIFKPVQGGAHTQLLLPGHLSEEHLRHLAISPVTIQQQIQGADIRVFVAGQQVHACQVQTTAVDFRDDPAAPVTPHQLPADIAALSRRVAAALHLTWAGIDFRLTPGGEYLFLEANPSPMFLGFESRTGLPLTAALIQLLEEDHSRQPPGE